jgi:hypothetical protein
MSLLIELEDGTWIQPRRVTAVRQSSLDKKKCVVFVSGQSATEGFLIDESVDDVVDKINDSLGEDMKYGR